MEPQRRRHRDRRLRGRRGRATTSTSLTELFKGASVVLQHRRPVQQARPRGRRGLPRRRRALPRHHRRAGLADHLRREVRRRLRRRRPAARARASRRCTRPARSPPSSASRQPGLDTLDIAVFWGGSPTIASTQTILVNAALVRRALPRAERLRAVGPRGRALPARHPRPARARARAALGRHVAPGLVPSATRGSPTSRRSAACSTRPLMLGVPQIVAARARGDQGHGRPTSSTPPSTATAAQVMNHDAAAREPAAQQVARLGARLRSARPRALRDPRQPELQADRAAAGVRGVLAAAAAAASGSGSPRAARRSGTASCSACCAASAWSSEPVLTVEA